MKKVIVGATHRQFMNWCYENKVPLGGAIFADSREKLMGLELADSDIIRLGTVPFEIEQIIQTRIRK